MTSELIRLLNKSKDQRKIQKKISLMGKKILEETYKEINFLLKNEN